MKIALVTYAMDVGGLEAVLLSLAHGLRNNGCNVTFVVTETMGEWHWRPTEEGFPMIAVLLSNWRSRQNHAKKVAKVLSDFDVVLLNHSRAAQSAAGLLPDATVALSVLHNIFEDIFTVGLSNAENLDRIVAVGERVREEALKHAVPPGKVVCIRNGVDVFSEYPKRGQSLVAEKPLQVMFLGRINHEQKGVFYLPDIMEQLGNSGAPVTLHIVGEGPDREALAARMVTSVASGSVEFHGAVSHQKAMRLMEEADGLLMPSHYEGQPITLFEAMARGVVPVVSLLPGITDSVIADGTDGFLVPVGDCGGFAAALDKLRNPDLRKAMSFAAWEKARKSYSVEAMTQQYLNLIEELLVQRKAGLELRRTGKLHVAVLGKRSQVPLVLHKVSGFLKNAIGMQGIAHGD